MVLEIFTSNPAETQMLVKVLISVLLGGVIGYEREKYNRPAGLRTHILVAMGATIFTVISLSAFPATADPSRMTAYVIVGIGFIGAGTVIQIKDKVVGLTTASSLWLAAAIGISVGVGYYMLATGATIIGFLVLSLKWLEKLIGTNPRRR